MIKWIKGLFRKPEERMFPDYCYHPRYRALSYADKVFLSVTAGNMRQDPGFEPNLKARLGDKNFVFNALGDEFPGRILWPA